MTNFVKQTSFAVDYCPSKITKWISSRTGLQLVYIDKPSPIISGHFAVATEIHNDSGCPHTLEHLCFLGSKNYPYKGVLDILGNLAFSQTNAWTSTDQTVYTLTTAGWDGFRSLLPIYLEHLIQPTLTEEGFVTEVYHVDGNGKEKGVVFSEMHGIQNQHWFHVWLNAQRALYPHSAYRSETGGLMENLRKLNNKDIVDYHKSYYVPENLCVIISGSIDESELLSTMTDFDNQIPLDLPKLKARPWIDSRHDIAPTETIFKTVEFPDKDESSGEVLFSWIGPIVDDTLKNVAIDIMGSYLTSGPISLLQKEFVECADPLAYAVSYYTEDYYHTNLNIELKGVPTEKLDFVAERVLSIIKSHAANVSEFDLEKINDYLQSAKWNYILSCENSSEGLTTIAISEFIYGKRDGSDLSKWTKDLYEYEILQSWSSEKWCNLLQEMLVNNKPVVMKGKPSKEMYQTIKSGNKKLLEQRKADLGAEGLKKAQDTLERAIKTNDAPIPDDILDSFSQPDPSRIKLLHTVAVSCGTNQYAPVTEENKKLHEKLSQETRLEDFPLFLQFQDIKTQFVSITVLVNTFNISNVDLKKYMEVFTNLNSLPIESENGEYLSYEDVVSGLKRDTISNHINYGIGGSFEDYLNINFIVKRENYSKAIEWIHKLMYQTKFDEDRVRVTIEKLVNSMAELKRNGSEVLDYLYNKNVFSDESLKKAKDTLYLEEFYKDLLNEIKSGGFSAINEKLELIRNQIFKLENIRVLVVADVEKLDNAVNQWNILVEGRPREEPTPVPSPSKSLSSIGTNLSNKAFIAVTPGSESTYLMFITKVPNKYSHEDVPKIALTASYLQAVEGPFWRGIRGAGLAYGTNVHQSVQMGQLVFDVYKGADGPGAIDVARKIVDDYANGSIDFEPKLIKGAVSAIVHDITENESTYFQVAQNHYINQVIMERGSDYYEQYLKKLAKVTKEDLFYCINKYFKPLFDKNSSVVFGCVHPGKAEELIAKLENEFGYDVTVEKIVPTNTSNEDGDVEMEDGDEDDEDDEDESDDESEYSSSDEEDDSD
ncbi:Putative metalloprotease [Komagataella phaffii CBS 7435]|uniref:Metalloprotease n=2 Tax=Komagataella phaffii TaxID=460519 RepID=C4R881_KOMPG|nr:Putative metalloprotease [Komagataella phaffii GS115]AOA65125.1 GQ67_04916T0 [Komagataella phaffii]CAH2450801.1 Putative metalloprotease [Komagataella phaffii CBS 7435]AOA69562.1 GQ68_04888T0 [Komagataella phaffii GS115]CAY71806.1 Putative metalloprotease [Komagataella phaffii GS115]CCA40595.1 Putative metalloprotease [Komagataella phaffii CBS 7435]